MTSEEYIKKVNDQVQSIFVASLGDNKHILNLGIDVSKSLQIWLDIIPEGPHKILLSNSIQSLEMSFVCQTYCFYRNAFSSLRLSLEMLFGAIHFSTSMLEFIEWTNSTKDLNWSTMNDFDNGVLSHRFCNAFFIELNGENSTFHTKAKDLYRDLSEYVHGNYHTWITKTEVLKVDNSAIELFYNSLMSFQQISNFALCLRYLKEFDTSKLEKVEPIILQNLNHIKPIHDYLST